MPWSETKGFTFPDRGTWPLQSMPWSETKGFTFPDRGTWPLQGMQGMWPPLYASAVMAYWEMQLFSCFLIRPWIRTLIRSLHFLYRKSLNSLNRFSSIFSFIYTWYMNLLFILNIKTLGSLFSGGCTGNFSYYRLWSNTSHSVPSCVASVSNYVNSYQYDPYTHPSFLANRQQRYICMIKI